MKKIFIAILLLIGIQSFSQSGYVLINGRYRWVATMADSALHIPRYNGVPSGLRVGSSTHDGALAADTLNGAVYFYWNAAWNKMALYADISGASSNIYNSNGILSGNRTLTGLNNTYSLNLDSLNSFRVQRNGTTRLLMNSTVTELASPNSTATVSVNNSNALISYSSNAFRAMADSFTATNKIVYETNINGSLTTPNSLVTRSLVDSLITAGGGNTIYTGNGTLAGNRQVTMDDKSLTFINSGENKLVVNPVSDTYSLGDGDGTAANINISSSTYTTNFSGVNFSKFTYTGRQWLIGDVDDNWDGIKIQMDNSGVTKYGSLTFGDSTHILIDDANHYFKFLTRESERVRLNESGILIPNGIMPTSGSGGTDSVVMRNSSTGQFYLGEGGGGGVTAANLPLRVTGSTVSADTSVAFNPSLASNQRLQKVIDSLAAVGALQGTINSNDWYQYYLTGTGGNASAAEVYYYFASGTGASIANIQSSQIDGWMFGQKLTTGTTNAGICYYYAAASPGSSYGVTSINTTKRYSWKHNVRFEDLSDGTETYSYYAGFLNDVSAFSSVTNGAGIRYAHTDSSGAWICWTKAGGSLTEDAVAFTVTADTDYLWDVTIIGGVAYFYVSTDGGETHTLATTIGTNVPAGSSQTVTTGIHFKKSNGTTARVAYLEMMAYGKSPN